MVCGTHAEFGSICTNIFLYFQSFTNVNVNSVYLCKEVPLVRCPEYYIADFFCGWILSTGSVGALLEAGGMGINPKISSFTSN